MKKKSIILITSLVLLFSFWSIIKISANNILLYLILPIVWVALLIFAVVFIREIIIAEKKRKTKFKEKRISLHSIFAIAIGVILILSLMMGLINVMIALFFDMNLFHYYLLTDKSNIDNDYCVECFKDFQETACYKCFTGDKW